MTRIRQMVLARRKARGDDPEAGFTLIELLVVLLIIAILLAIAVPTFLSARTNAQNGAAQSTLRNALVDVQAYYTQHDGFAGITDAKLAAAEPAISWLTSGSAVATANQVEVAAHVVSASSTPVGQSVVAST